MYVVWNFCIIPLKKTNKQKNSFDLDLHYDNIFLEEVEKANCDKQKETEEESTDDQVQPLELEKSLSFFFCDVLHVDLTFIVLILCLKPLHVYGLA